MNSIYNQELGKLIDLNNIKIINQTNKKIICTSLFLPEFPSISIKTPVYILGLIKTLETFRKNMGKDWILRVYYDSMFDKGLNLKKLDRKTEKMLKKFRRVSPGKSYALVTAAQHNIKKGIQLKKRVSSTKSYANALKKKVQRKISPYEYQYNSLMDNNQSNIKKEIIKNKDYLKKMIKLVHLYFKHIVKSNEEQYKNIELVSYDCQKASNNPDIIGHPSTFGSIMRFLPLYDENVSTFFCINSRYPITNIQKFLINEWEYNIEQKMLVYNYINEAVGHRVESELNKTASFIKNKNKENYTKDDLMFINFVDSIYKFKHKVFSTKNLETFDKLKKDLDILIGITYRGARGQSSRTNYSDSIAAGFFGYKKNCPYHLSRSILLSKLLSYLIQSKNQFSYGIDEVLLKIILAFEVGTGELSIGSKKSESVYFLNDEIRINSKYLKILFRQETKCNSLHYIFNKKNSYLENNEGNKIVIGDIIKDGIYYKNNWRGVKKKKYLKDLITELELLDIGILESRSLYVAISKEKEKQLTNNETIYHILCKNKKSGNLDLTLHSLFLYTDEPKKLFLIDTSKYDSLNKFLNVEVQHKDKKIKMEQFYNIIDINNYSQQNIEGLLKSIILYYRRVHKLNIVQFKYSRQMGKLYNTYNSNSSNSDSNSILRSKKKKKNKFLNSIIQTKKALKSI